MTAGLGIVGDGAGKNIDCAAAWMSDPDEREVDGFRRSGCSRIEACELTDAELGVDFDTSVDFLAAVAVRFKANFRFQELDLGGSLRLRLLAGWLRGLLLGWIGVQRKKEQQSRNAQNRYR